MTGLRIKKGKALGSLTAVTNKWWDFLSEAGSGESNPGEGNW
jgi:hypothetical protein